MIIFDEYDYRNAKAVLHHLVPDILDEIYGILTDPENQIDLTSKGAQRNLSKQVQKWFVNCGWRSEVPSFAIPDMRYDLIKANIPIEIELGHQRLVFPDFFEFLADFSKGHIPAAVMIVTGNPELFGHNWHCSLQSTKRKIEAIQEVFLVSTFVLAVNP
jgi:hypothetical protein